VGAGAVAAVGAEAVADGVEEAAEVLAAAVECPAAEARAAHGNDEEAIDSIR